MIDPMAEAPDFNLSCDGSLNPQGHVQFEQVIGIVSKDLSI
jgi:hypothetical protein